MSRKLSNAPKDGFSVDVPWEALDDLGSKTQVGMLPQGIGARARLAWLTSRWRPRVRLSWLWHPRALRVIGASLAILVVAIGIDLGRAAFAPEPAPIAIARPAPPAPKKAAIAKKRVATTKSAAPRVKSEWTPVTKPAPKSDLVSAGHIYMRTGKLSAAEDAFRSALAQNRSDGEARFWLATVESSRGKKWRACRNFRKYLDGNPTGEHAHDARTNLKTCD